MWFKIRTYTNGSYRKVEWGRFEHTKAVFNNEIIPFLKSLKDIFNVFDRDLLHEIMEVKTVFDQIDAAVQQSSIDKQCLEIAKKELLLENDRLLKQIMSQDVLLIVMKSMSLIGETNDLKAQLQDKDSAICKLKDMIKSMREKSKDENVKYDYCEIETKNVELENKNEDLKAQIQDKVFVITSLKNDLRKIKGKEIVDIAAQIPSASTIVPGMFKLDLEPLAPRLSRFYSRTVRFKNDHIARIMGYGDYQLGNVTISKEKLYLLHMDLYGQMHVASINGKWYILVIVDDYSRFTWVRFLRIKDEAPEAIIKFIKNILVCLNATVYNVRTDNGTKFVNQTLREFYENVGIYHQTSVARTPQ
ncbi:retrovirus-related pol polyprotein from transposon TNT 1-94 [Tanacetum coccineum]